jgi:Flp pilus assembly protein CpaB
LPTRLLGTRNGTLALAAGAALLAAIVLILFLQQYKDDVTGGAAPTTALVAGSLIPKGTSGDVVIGDSLFKPTTVSEGNLADGAIADASGIAGRVATRDIFPGEQIKASDFAGASDPLRGKLNGNERAVSVPVSAAQGLVGEIRAGDRIDVMGGFNASREGQGTTRPVVRTLLQNVLVLRVPDSDGATTNPDDRSTVTLRVTEKQAAVLAYAVDNGKVWFSLRPPAGASQGRPSSVNLDDLLSDSPAIQVGGQR